MDEPIYGCSGCAGTVGRAACAIHGAQATALATPNVFSWDQPSSRPHICPVCAGRGVVGAGFYAGPVAGSTAPELCRSCRGSGIVWAPPSGLARMQSLVATLAITEGTDALALLRLEAQAILRALEGRDA